MKKFRVTVIDDVEPKLKGVEALFLGISSDVQGEGEYSDSAVSNSSASPSSLDSSSSVDSAS